MLLKDFYRTVVLSEETAVAFLRSRNLLDSVESAKPCHRCGNKVQEKKKRSNSGDFRLVLRCPLKGCQTTRSVRRGNSFFHYTDVNDRLNCKLSLCEILELVMLFVLEIPMDTVAILTGKSHNTIADWSNLCRDVCRFVVSSENRGQMVGTLEDPIRIDQSQFGGKRKPTNPNEGEDSGDDGTWVLGLQKGTDVRYFYAEKRDRNALATIIKRECKQGSVIHTDEWPGYGNLDGLGFDHYTVDRKESVELATGKSLRQISWSDSKTRILKKMKGVKREHLQSHLDHFCWKIMRKDADDLFIAFLDDIQTVYR